MTNSKTKRTLLVSCMSLLLCFAMLLGTTFAWFTDSVTSANNIITSGNLDVKLEYWNGTVWKTVEGASDVLTNTLWEPGVTEVAYLKVSNAGSLALKYQLGVNIVSEKEGKNVAGETFKLSDSIMFGVIENTSDVKYANRADAVAAVTDAKKISAGYVKEAEIEANTSVHYFALVVYMPETVTNEANHNGTDIPEINLGINAFATQLAAEEDSFGKDYDDKAALPETVSSVDELKEALKDGGNIVLAEDIKLTETLMANEDAVIDLNGNAVTAPDSNVLFQSQSNAKPSMVITSSEAGAQINVSGGDMSVLLGYGSTEISNVTINVTGCDNASPNPFNVYGDLTLGKGTVINVDYLGTSLISNNGAADIVIDGAKINIGTFKTNGTAIIALNNTSTLKMKNTSVAINEFVLSAFGGDSLVSKVDGVTIESCTFDVTDSNGASCTFEAKDGKYRLVQE